MPIDRLRSPSPLPSDKGAKKHLKESPFSNLKKGLFGARRKEHQKTDILGGGGKRYPMPGQKTERISFFKALGGVVGGMPVKKKTKVKSKEKPSPFSEYFKRTQLEQELEKAKHYDPKHFQKREQRKALVKKWFPWEKFPKHDISPRDVSRARTDLEKEYWQARGDPTKRWKMEREKEIFEKEFGKRK